MYACLSSLDLSQIVCTCFIVSHTVWFHVEAPADNIGHEKFYLYEEHAHATTMLICKQRQP